MKPGFLTRSVIAAVTALALSATALQPVAACTRAVFIGGDGMVVTGRSMDWKEDMYSNMWAFPRRHREGRRRRPQVDQVGREVRQHRRLRL